MTAHIKLMCWEHRHVQAISAEELLQLETAPICTMCASPIWAVEHEDEPTRYVGRPPHHRWQAWAECVPHRQEA